MLVRECGYTWEEVMQEKLPRTLYSLEQLEEEGEKRREQQEENEKNTPNI